MKLNLREIEVFKPYANELPEQILADEGLSDADIDRWLDAPILRIAKRNEESVGVYALRQEDEHRFELFGVIVTPPIRRQGLGRWLIGHAIGVAESKGGRHIWIGHPGSTRCFSHIGFSPVSGYHGRDRAVQFDMILE
ncbi:MAG: GNAT family N-acetyltransferase [Pseudomonadota bacterium]